MDLREFSKKVFECANNEGFSECEIYYVQGDSLGIKIFNEDLQQFSNSNIQGFSFRGLYNGKMGYSYAEKISEDVIQDLLGNAKINATLIENSDVEEIYEGVKDYPKVNAVSEELRNVSTSKKLEVAYAMEKYAKSLSDKIFQVSICSISTVESEVTIINTKGLDISHRENNMFAVLSVIAKDGDSTKTFYEYWYGNDINNFDYKALCEKTVDGALKRINAKSTKSGKFDIIIERDAMISLLSTFWTIFNAKTVQDNLSKMKGQLGRKVASDKVTLIDDGMLKDGKMQVPFDSEGYTTEKTVIIDNGVLNSFLHSSKTARKDGVKSTGNGFKSSYKSSVQVQTTNFYLQNGDVTFDELVKKLNNGIIVDSLSGLHSGVSIVSGDFSLLAEGFLVENGEIVRPIEQITISGNFYELLMDIKEVASDIRYDLASNATIASPSVLVAGINVVGE